MGGHGYDEQRVFWLLTNFAVNFDMLSRFFAAIDSIIIQFNFHFQCTFFCFQQTNRNTNKNARKEAMKIRNNKMRINLKEKNVLNEN